MGRLRKEEYIAKYGEQAWKEYLEKANTFNKNRYHTNKEKYAEYRKKYYEAHREEILKYSVEYHKNNKEKRNNYSKSYRETNKEELAQKRKQKYLDNKDVYTESGRKYRLKHKEKISANNKKYRELHKEELKEYQVNLRKTELGRAKSILHSYEQRDKKNEVGVCTLTKEWIVDNIFASKCIYCGDSDWRHLGCDRIDNSLPHTPENCVCACGVCNIERQIKKMSVEEFTEFRKTHPRGWDRIENIKSEIVEVSGVKVLRKKVG